MNKPYLKSEAHYQRYAGYIDQIVSGWPGPVALKPKPPVASVETLASRLRICISALRDAITDGEHWKLNFTEPHFSMICDSIVTSTTFTPGMVVCGSSSVLKEKTKITRIDPVIEQIVPKVNLHHPDGELIKAIMVLHHHRLLTEPSTIEANADGANFIDHFSRYYDIAVERDGDKFTIL